VIHNQKFENRLKWQQILVPPLWKRNLQTAPTEQQLEKKLIKQYYKREDN